MKTYQQLLYDARRALDQFEAHYNVCNYSVAFEMAKQAQSASYSLLNSAKSMQAVAALGSQV